MLSCSFCRVLSGTTRDSGHRCIVNTIPIEVGLWPGGDAVLVPDRLGALCRRRGRAVLALRTALRQQERDLMSFPAFRRAGTGIPSAKPPDAFSRIVLPSMWLSCLYTSHSSLVGTGTKTVRLFVAGKTSTTSAAFSTNVSQTIPASSLPSAPPPTDSLCPANPLFGLSRCA